MEHLFEKLEAYGQGDIYPYHMPGHKRKAWGNLPASMYEMDITEIDGFDNLHQSEDLLLALQQKASELYGAEESFYLVNGSTCGILSAVSSAVPFGGHILMARNCHKSAYHAAYLRNLTISYLYPTILEDYDIFEAITPTQVREALEREPDIDAVLIVSPTYEGRIADVKKIADIVHERGCLLIVDEAHGAHLGFAEGFARNSCHAGADLVIHSVHKTLPAPTQTALLHVNGSKVCRDTLRRFLHIYQSSSPSYLLMAGIDNALQYVEQEGKEKFECFRQQYSALIQELRKCRNFKILLPEADRQDIGKLLVSTKTTKFTGKQLYDILLNRYHLQLEMASESYVLAMFTVNDGQEAYARMRSALLELDAELDADTLTHEEEAQGVGDINTWSDETLPNGLKQAETGNISLYKAWDAKKEQVLLSDSVGRIVGEFINLYPPGVPILVPGERMTKELCADIFKWQAQGLIVQGLDTHSDEDMGDVTYIKVLGCESR